MAASESWQRVAGHFHQQAEACGDLGSPLYAGLIAALAEDLLAGGPTAEVLAGHERDPGPAALALRLLGGVHRLVLERQAPDLALFFPSVGGSADVDAAWPALRRVLETRGPHLRGYLDQPPQTNEVGRGAALVGGLLHLVAELPGPLRLFEMGASAGLNLRADHFRVALADGAGVGPARSPVVLRNAWSGRLPPLGARIHVVERSGCDVEPLDPTSAEGRLGLTSYVWPDQQERLERLRGALALAQEVPATVRRQGAADFVNELRLEDGDTTVLWHSVMWQYLATEEQAAVAARIDELGTEATAAASFAHLRLEPEGEPAGHGFPVRLRVWPGGEDRLLADAHPHGLPTTWL